MYECAKESPLHNYRLYFQSVIYPLLEKANYIIDMAASVAETPEKLAKLVDEIKVINVLHNAPNGHEIDLSLGSSMDEETMKKWVQAAFRLSEPPVYYDMAKEDTKNIIIQNYKDSRNHRRNVEEFWSSYFIKPDTSTKTKETVHTLASMVRGTVILLEYIAGCMVNTVKDDEYIRDTVGSIVFGNYFYVIDNFFAFISTAVCRRVVYEAIWSIDESLKGYKDDMVHICLNSFGKDKIDLSPDVRKNVSLYRFYADSSITDTVFTEMLETLRMLDLSTSNLEKHFKLACRDSIKVFRNMRANLGKYRMKTLVFSPSTPVFVKMQIQESCFLIKEMLAKYHEPEKAFKSCSVLEIVSWVQNISLQLSKLQKCADRLDDSISKPCKDSLRSMKLCLKVLNVYLGKKLDCTKEQTMLGSNIQALIQSIESEYASLDTILSPLHPNHTNTNTNINSDTNGNTNTNSDGNTNPNPNINTNSDTNTNTNTNTNSDSDSDGSTSAVSISA
ncbi:hypothetical protein NECID01_1116 [Nematocida sp. AWRm77]|nr:hypothetical protein NECID01_1116 [Nematocida sp. AWRm77]